MRAVSWKRLSLCGCVLLLGSAPLVAQADDERWQIGTAPTFSSGKYGTDTRTDILYAPVSIRRLFDDGDLTLIAPFTCISGNGGVTLVGGVPIRKEQSANSGPGNTNTASTSASVKESGSSGNSGSGRSGGSDDDLSPGTGALGRTVTTCGAGDLILRGRYYLVDEHDWVPTIAVRGHVKIPTADADRGLGTGRFDEGAGLEISKKLIGDLMGFIDGGYTFIGDPKLINFNNQWWYDVGLGYDVSTKVNLSVFYEEYRAIVPGLTNPRDVLIAMNVKGSGGWRYQASTMVGLSNGAPDYAVTVGISRRF